MLKTLLGYIFTLSTILFYIYYGIRLVDNFKSKTEITIYIISYVLLGFTILNLLLVSKYWEILSNKRGPPGPRGLMGVEGDAGVMGSCSLDHNVMFALIQIKRAIGEAITELDSDTKIGDIYNDEENTLTNSTMDTLINRIVQSKEFDTILLRPDTSETMKYGKSLKDIVGYLKSIIVEWCVEIYKLSGGVDFFKRVDGSFTDTKEIENYFHSEIEKYDIWYWGGTRVFKPLEIMVMRQTEYRDSNGQIQQNSAFPMDDKPRLEFIEVEYSDRDTRNLVWLWDAIDIGNSAKKEQLYEVSENYRDWQADKVGLYGSYVRPAIYMPKARKIGNKKYYPMGCVVLEGNPENKTSVKKKTLLVSGDVIIPTKFNLMWKDRRRMHVIKNGGQPSDGIRAALFWRLGADNRNYVVLGDIPQSKTDGNKYQRAAFLDDTRSSLRLLKDKLRTDNNGMYRGIVAVPKDLVKEIDMNEYPEWSYKLNGDPRGKFNHGRYQVDIFTGKGGSEINYNIVRFKNARFNMNITNRGDKFYTIDTEANKHRTNPLKETEPENNDLGFGYYGYPYLITDKYSIFKLLDLVPEGLIINYNNNRKLYIRHYGGAEPNRYNIFKYDTKTGRYDKALKVSSPSKIEFSRMKPADPRFAFSYEVDKDDARFIRFRSVSNPDDGYLKYISQITNTHHDKEKGNRPAGVSIDHTRSTFVLKSGKGENNKNNKKLFMFLQAHGRGLTDVEQPRLKLDKMKYPGSKNTYTPITPPPE
jgi:hypothetical protein